MTDKVQKIREEVKKLHGNPYYMMAVKDVLAIIDTLQEELVSEDLEDTTQTITYNGEVYIRCYKDKLDAFACKYPMLVPKPSKRYAKYSDVDLTIAVKKGAQWQKEQFEKERLKHCDELTNEQAQIESDFVTQHLKENNRTPTFIDAIEYGMRLKEKEMQSTIELAEDHAILAGMEKMREEMIEDTPKWKKHIESLLVEGAEKIPCVLSNRLLAYHGYTIEIAELEKLPKED